MLSNIKILVSDHKTGCGVETADYFRRNGAYAVARNNSSCEILKFIEEQNPDMVIMNNMLDDMEAIEFVERASLELAKPPTFIIISSFINERIRQSADAHPEVYFIIKSFEEHIFQEKLCKIIYSLKNGNSKHLMNTVESETTETIKRLGIPAHVKGYNYVRSAILACFNETLLLESITKMLYPYVAEQYSTTPSRVERAIRHAIEIAWKRGNIEVFSSVFGYSVKGNKGKPTNSEFIAIITDNLILKYKRSQDDGNNNGRSNIFIL